MQELSTQGVIIEHLASASLEDPVLIEGLPGVGNVGKLAVEHLLEEREHTPLRRIYSEHLPPQVTIDEEGVASLPVLTVHHVHGSDRDLVVISGNHQSATAIGHYRLTNAILDIAEELSINQLFALGGVPTGDLVDDRAVMGAVSVGKLRPPLEECGVEFRENEPTGGIVGVSGLLLGLGAQRDLEVACLMGETSGYLVDPVSAQAILEILACILDLNVDYERLEARAEEMAHVVRRLRDLEEGQSGMGSTDDNLRYIG